MEATSLTPQQEKLNALRLLLPEVFAEGKIDWEKLRATLGEAINFSNERYVLNWADKSDAFKVLQTPTTKTLVPAKAESSNFDDTEHIFIEGENLAVLKVLQKSYFGKVKMIYIDPPYNTGNDSFIYPDKFSETRAEYARRVGDKDEDGYMTNDGMFKKNSKENGQYHSNWLSMMMPRLYLAKNLLRQDGVIFVSIDDNEVHNLRLLMNEIFGEENFVASYVWESTFRPDNSSKIFRKNAESVICYCKNIFNIKHLIGSKEGSDGLPSLTKNSMKECKLFFNGNTVITFLKDGLYQKGVKSSNYELLNDVTVKDGLIVNSFSLKGKMIWSQEYLEKELQNGTEIIIKTEGFVPYTKKSTSSILAPNTIIPKDVVGDVLQGRSEVAALFKFPIFDYPKPTSLPKYLINYFEEKDFIILDFFAGSGTTAQAVMELNKEDGGRRKYICVQLPEACDASSEAHKAGYATIAEISKERIRRAAKKIAAEIAALTDEIAKKIAKLQAEIQTEETITEIANLNAKIAGLTAQDLGFKVLKLADSNFKEWRQIEGNNVDALQAQMELFTDPVVETATVENMVYEFLLKSGKGLNSKITHQGDYYSINDGEIIMLLEAVTQAIIGAVIAQKPHKVIALDKLFEGNDQLKTNTVLQMRDAGIEFKTV